MSARYRRLKNRLFIGLMALAVALCILPLLSLLWTLIARGSKVLSLHLLTTAARPVGDDGGILHAIAGSMWLLAVATLIAAPIGLAMGLYLSQRIATPLARITRTLLDVMTGIPAIIVGVFIYSIVIQRGPLSLGMRRFSMISGGLALAMIMLPIFARTSEEALRLVPQSLHEAGLALGLRRRTIILRIVLRSAMSGVMTALFLALARVCGEAAPLLFTAFGSNDTPAVSLAGLKHGAPLTQPVSSLPQLLYDYARQPFPELVDKAWGAALVLVAMILGIRLCTNLYIRWRFGREGRYA